MESLKCEIKKYGSKKCENKNVGVKVRIIKNKS